MNDYSEDRIQQDCYMWFNNNFRNLRKMLFAVPNGGKRDVVEAKRMKATGTVSGVSDLILAYGGTCHFIEMKTSTGRQDDEQVKFQKGVEAQGMNYYLCRTLEDFIRIVKNIVHETEFQNHKSIS